MVLWLRNFIVSFVIFLMLGAVLAFPFQETKADSTLNTSIRISICGDNNAEGSEQCDGTDLNDETCISRGYVSGNLSCTSCTFDVSGCASAPPVTPPPAPSGGGGGGGGSATTQVILQGIAYPLSKITVLKDGQIIADNILADAQANFKIALTTITAGAYTFGIWAEDKDGRKSITFSFTATVLYGMTTTIGGIFLPPTIELSKVNLLKGETLKILGKTAPQSEVTLQVESTQTITKIATSTVAGDWSYLFDTSPLDEGSHTARAKAEASGGLLSSFSKVMNFFIGKYGTSQVCDKADFNKEGRTNLVDFSILLYWWGKYNPCVDQNQDGLVNLKDFSILMYWWTG